MRRTNLLYGAIGAVAATAAAGLTAERVITGRRRRASLEVSPFDQDPEAARSRTVRTEDGVPLAVEEYGPTDAPLTVVFVHGFCLSSRTFVFQRRALVDEFGDAVRLVLYDHRGHGRSGPCVPSSATIEQLGRDLHTVLDAVVPDGPVVLVAHSMGGMTAMAFAADYPELFRGRSARIGGVALIATSPGGMREVSFGLPAVLGRVGAPLTPWVLRGARRQAALVERSRRIGGDIAWAFTRRLSFGDRDVDPAVVDFLDGLISATRIEAIADFYPALMSHDGTAGLRVLRDVDDVVILGAERDLITPLSHSERIADLLPDAQFVEVRGAGHVVMLERPDEVDDVLVDLVSRALDRAGRTRGRTG